MLFPHFFQQDPFAGEGEKCHGVTAPPSRSGPRVWAGGSGHGQTHGGWTDRHHGWWQERKGKVSGYLSGLKAAARGFKSKMCKQGVCTPADSPGTKRDDATRSLAAFLARPHSSCSARASRSRWHACCVHTAGVSASYAWVRLRTHAHFSCLKLCRATGSNIIPLLLQFR